MKYLFLTLILLISGCLQPVQFTRDCSKIKDVSIGMNCYREQAYYRAAIGDVSGALQSCREIQKYLFSFDHISVSIYAFDKTLADLTRVLFVSDNYNNCILNVARLARDESICSNMVTTSDLIRFIPALATFIDQIIPVTVSSEEMCRIDVRSISARYGVIKPFDKYIE